MANNDIKSISIRIAGRSYPLKIEKEDEIFIRKIVDEVNEKVKKFQLNYQRKDQQDCLSMALLTYAVDYHSLKESSKQKDLQRKIRQIDILLDNMLK